MFWKCSTLLFVGFFCTVVIAVNIPNVRHCQSKNEYLRAGHVATYRYDWSVVGGAVGSTPHTVQFSAECTFTVKSYRKCYHSLQVQSCDLRAAGPPSSSQKAPMVHSEAFASLMKRHKTIFSLANGNVENVIAHVDETLAILNIKRGIIGSLMTVVVDDQSQVTRLMRNDVQGICPVTYSHSDVNTIRMVKDVNGCHFPAKPDWNYSPFSLFWNMSFIQTFYINSSAECSFTFGEDDGSLSTTSCRERHAIGLDSTANTAISVQTNVVQNTFLLSSVKHGDKSLPSTVQYLLKKIQYEYESSTSGPTVLQQPSNFTSQVEDALVALIAESQSPIKPEVVDHFIRLVALLRSASQLDALVKQMVNCDIVGFTCTPIVKQNMLNYFADALVQCSTVPCVRAFRQLIEEPDSAIGDVYLTFVLYSWTNIPITDPDFLQEILAICEARKTRFCSLVLSTAIHEFWMRNEDSYFKKDLPVGLKNGLDFVFGLIGDDCEQVEDDVLTGLKALGNIGYVAEKYKPDLSEIIDRCMSLDKVSWTVQLAAIQAGRRFLPTTYLYGLYIGIVKDVSRNLEFRIEAYKVLVDKWADTPQMLRDLKTVLMDSDGTDFRFRNFVLSHLKSAVTRRTPSSMNFARTIRRAMEDDSKLSRLIASNAIDSDRNRKSVHTEQFYYHETPILRPILNRFGLRFGVDRLHDNDSFLPFAVDYNLTVQLFGKEVNLLEVSTTTRGTHDIIMSMADLFAKRQNPIDGYEILAALFRLFGNSGNLAKFSGIPESQLRFPYKVDDDFRENLERIRREFGRKLDPTRTTTLEFAIRMFGNELFFTTGDHVRKTFSELNRFASRNVFKDGGHLTSGLTQIVEAFNLIPMLTGSPLNWTTEAFLVHSGHFSIGLSKNKGQTTVSVPIEFSGAAVLINKMIVGVPGVHYGGIQSYSTASTSFDTELSVTFGGTEGTKLNVAPSKRPIRILRLSRRNHIFFGQEKTELPDNDVDRYNASWCLPIIGINFCHDRSYPNVTHRLDKPWCLMAGSSHWELTAKPAPSGLKTYELTVQNKPTIDGGSNTVLRLSGIGDDEARELVVYDNRVNWTSGEYESDFRIPEMHLETRATRQRLESTSGFSSKAYVSMDTHETHSIDYSTSERDSHVVAPTGSDESVLAHIMEHYVNVTVKSSLPEVDTRIYSWNRTRSQYPRSIAIDHHFAYFGVRPTNPSHRLLGDILWENSRSAWVNLRQHKMADLDYYHLQTPHSIMQIRMSGAGQRFDFNFTKTMLPTNELKTYLNMSYTTESHVDVTGTSESTDSVSLATPSQSVVVRGHRRWNRVDSNMTVTFGIDQKKVDMRGFDVSEPEVARRLRAHSHQMKLSSHLRNETAEALANTATPSKPNKRSNRKYSGHWSLTLPGQKPVTFEGSYHEDDSKTYRLDFSIVNPISNVRFETTNKLTTNDIGRVQFHHKSTAAMNSPLDDMSKIDFLLNASLIGGGRLVVHQTTDSPDFKSTIDLAWNLKAPAYSDLRFNVTTESPTWELLKIDLNQIVFVGGETMTIRHGLMDIDVQSDWRTGFKRTVIFNSKMTHLFPNMVWNMDFTDPFDNGLVVHVHFPEVNHLDVYLIVRLAADFREIRVTFCRHEKCRDIQNDPMSFIGEWTYTLDDPTHLTETVVYNPVAIDALRQIWIPQMAKISEVVTAALSNADHPLNRMLKPVLKLPLAQWFASKMTSASNFRFKMGHHVLVSILDFPSVYNPCIQMLVRAYNYASDQIYRTYSEPIFVPNFVPWFWSYFEMKSVLPIWTWDTLMEFWNRIDFRPGPVLDRSYVRTYHLPIHLSDFASRPWPNAAYSRAIKETVLTLTEDEMRPNLRSIFRPSTVYDRFALIWDSRHVRTFDGHFVDLKEDPQCTRLLLHNTFNARVTVAQTGSRNGQITFLFPQMKIVLHSDGRIFLNGSDVIVTDPPIRSSDGYVNVTRLENVISVDTFHHVTVKCIVDENYCLFGTTPWTQGLLVGLLSTDNRRRRPETISRFRLSAPPTCTEAEAETEIENCPNVRSDQGGVTCDSAFGSPLSPTILYCHDVIDPKPFGDRCRSKRFGCSQKVCPTVRSYLALCAAHGLPVDSLPQCSFCADGHRLGESWRDVVTTDVDIVLLTDHLQRSSAVTSLRKGVELLMETIERTFTDDGYDRVRFGLINFRSEDDSASAVQQLSLNGKLLSSLDEFVRFGLKRRDLGTSSEDNSTAVTLDALQTACNRYPFSPKAVRIFMLMTSRDPEMLEPKRLPEVLEHLEGEAATLYVVSGYPDIAKGTKVYGVRGDGQVFPRSKGKAEHFIDYPKGQYAKLTSATRGSLFLQSFLELPVDSRGPFQRYISTVANELLARAKQDVDLCRSCHCIGTANSYAPKIKCRQFKCTE